MYLYLIAKRWSLLNNFVPNCMLFCIPGKYYHIENDFNNNYTSIINNNIQ